MVKSHDIVEQCFKKMNFKNTEDCIREMSFIFDVYLKKAWHSGYDEGYKNGRNDKNVLEKVI